MDPTLIGYFNVRPKTDRLEFVPAHPMKLTHLLVWGSAPGSLLRELSVACEPQLSKPVSLRLHESLVPTAELQGMGSMVALESMGATFFQLRHMTSAAAARLRLSGRKVGMSTVLPGSAVRLGIDGDVRSVAFFGYEAGRR